MKKPFIIDGNSFLRIKGRERGGAILVRNSLDLIIQSNSFQDVLLEGENTKGSAIFMTHR